MSNFLKPPVLVNGTLQMMEDGTLILIQNESITPPEDCPKIDDELYSDDLNEELVDNPAPCSSSEDTSSFWSTVVNMQVESKIIRTTTDLLIHFYGENQKLFKDQKTKKMQVWCKIANSMKSFGYEVLRTPKKSSAQICDEKWRNIKSIYLKHKNPCTGESFKRKPVYYDAIDAIIGDSELVLPKFTFDSLNPPSTNTPEVPAAVTLESSLLTPTCSKESSGNRNMSNIKRKLKPNPASGGTLKFLKESHADFLQISRERNELLKNLHDKDFGQMERLLEIMAKKKEDSK